MKRILCCLWLALWPAIALGQAGVPTNFVPKADVLLVRKNRVVQAFNALANTDAARGTALLAAKAAAVSDADILQCGPGNFDLQTSVLDLSRGGTGFVHLRGMGSAITQIKSQSTPIASGVIVHPGSGSEVSDLSINSSLANGSFQAPFGCNSAAGESAFTGVVVRNVRILGDTDGIYVSHTSACDAVFFNVEGYTKYDVVALFPPTTGPNHKLDFYGCRFRCTGPNTTSPFNGQTRCINSRIGTARFFNCEFLAENGGDGSNDETISIQINGGNVEMYGGSAVSNGDNTNTSAVRVQSGSFIGQGAALAATGSGGVSAKVISVTGGSAEVSNCRLTSGGTGTPLDLHRTGGTLTVNGSRYDSTKTSGTISQGLWQGTTPSSTGLALVGATDGATARTAISAASGIANTRVLSLPAFAPTADITTGDGKYYYRVPAALNGLSITSVHALAITAGIIGGTDIQIARIRGGTPVDVLSTKMTIDSGETGSDTGTPGTINASNDDLATGDILRIDVDAVSTTAPKGLVVTIEAGP